MNTENISREDWLLGGTALLLAITLLFFPWFSIGLGSLGSVDFTATDAPDGWLGILAVLSAILLVADLLIERTSPETNLPSLGGSRTQTRVVLAGAATAFVALKFLFHVHFSLFGFGFWLAVVLTVALMYLAIQANTTARV